MQIRTMTPTTTHITKQLSSLFASFLTGNSNLLVGVQKYFELHMGDSTQLRSDYDNDKLQFKPLLSRVPVRINSTVYDAETNSYYATFISTLQGPLEALSEDIGGSTSTLSLALVAGDRILAFTPFPLDTYKSLSNTECRVDINWKLQLTSDLT